jgi:hypothetical protein
MKHPVPLLLALLASPTLISGQQAPVIRLSDLHTEAGLYYKAYANDYQPLSPATSYSVGNQMGSAGPDRFWNFSEGPTDRILRFDYLSPTGIPEAADFPLATVVERKSVENAGEIEWLFFEAVPGVGRRVHGFHSEQFSPGSPSTPFSQPIVDFPDGIRYQDTWTTSFSTESEFPSLDPEWTVGFPMQVIWSSQFTADAWGVVQLPRLGLVDALRINEELTLDIAADLGDGYQHIVTEYVRNYYWLSPGRGLVAQIGSTQGSTMPPENFSLATAFVRMFETNKKPGSTGTAPQPVNDLRVTVSNERVLIQWQKAPNASRYRVEASAGDLGSAEWVPLVEETANDYFFDPVGPTQQARFYRVVSLP